MCTARCHQVVCVCLPQQEEGGVPRRASSSPTARRDVGLIRVDLRSTTSVPRRARPRLSWNIRPESCEALICCGGGSGFEPYSIQFNSIQFNSIQFSRHYLLIPSSLALLWGPLKLICLQGALNPELLCFEVRWGMGPMTWWIRILGKVDQE